eukprot:8520194-Pyramimonas_sp.AAC.1
MPPVRAERARVLDGALCRPGFEPIPRGATVVTEVPRRPRAALEVLRPVRDEQRQAPRSTAHDVWKKDLK